jgi:hypothetical protein
MQNVAISDGEALETGLKITTENASRFLEYHEAFRILICTTHGYLWDTRGNDMDGSYGSFPCIA